MFLMDFLLYSIDLAKFFRHVIDLTNLCVVDVSLTGHLFSALHDLLLAFFKLLAREA